MKYLQSAAAVAAGIKQPVFRFAEISAVYTAVVGHTAVYIYVGRLNIYVGNIYVGCIYMWVTFEYTASIPGQCGSVHWPESHCGSLECSAV